MEALRASPAERQAQVARSESVLPALFSEAAANSTGPSQRVRDNPTTPATSDRPEPPAKRRRRQFHLPLAPPENASTASGNKPKKADAGLASVATVVGSLAVVLGLFFVLVWAMRRAAPRGSMVLPSEVVEVLGRAPLAARQQVHLLRCGAKLLLVSVTPTGAETLTEITDPDEVTRLAGLCRQGHPDSATAAFRDVFGQLSREGSVLGFFGSGAGKDNATTEGRDA